MIITFVILCGHAADEDESHDEEKREGDEGSGFGHCECGSHRAKREGLWFSWILCATGVMTIVKTVMRSVSPFINPPASEEDGRNQWFNLIGI